MVCSLRLCTRTLPRLEITAHSLHAQTNTNALYCRAVSCKSQQMRNLIFFALISVFFISCKDNRFDSIDFLAYSYREFDTENPDYQREWKLFCPFYLHIDNDYNCQLIRGSTFLDSNTYYFESKKDPKLKEIINEIVNKSNDLKTETDFRSSQPAIYDGSDLNIRITRNGKSKIIHFWQDEVVSETYEKLYSYSIALFKNSSNLPIDSQAYKRRQEFIEFAINSDSIYRPLPPNPPREFNPEYIPPKVIK
jgi:hypothetical protein